MVEVELSLEYWNKLADQLIFISALLGGFSLTVIATLVNNQKNSPTSLRMLRAATIAAVSFLIAIFSMTKILMMTTEGYPFPITPESFSFPRLMGFLSFCAGIISLLVIVSLSGWTKSRSLGIFTTIAGIVAFFLLFAMLT